MAAIGEPEKFIVCEPVLDPLPVKEVPEKAPLVFEPEPDEVPAGGE